MSDRMKIIITVLVVAAVAALAILLVRAPQADPAATPASITETGALPGPSGSPTHPFIMKG